MSSRGRAACGNVRKVPESRCVNSHHPICMEQTVVSEPVYEGQDTQSQTHAVLCIGVLCLTFIFCLRGWADQSEVN